VALHVHIEAVATHPRVHRRPFPDARRWHARNSHRRAMSIPGLAAAREPWQVQRVVAARVTTATIEASRAE